MVYGYIYKISTTATNKVYIGQTIRTIEKRYQEHLNNRFKSTRKHAHLYEAMNKYGIETFSVEEIDTASNQKELDKKERQWIKKYDAIKNGYNMAPGGQGTNIFESEAVRAHHAKKMHSPEVRKKISKTMHELRTTQGFSEEHKRKIRESSQRRKEERAKLGLKFYDDCSHCATRNLAVYCILDTGERFDFASIKEAGVWWYNNYKPFGDNYSVPTFQRKIEASIAGKDIIYQSGHNSTKKGQKNVIYKIENIKWYRKEGGDV